MLSIDCTVFTDWVEHACFRRSSSPVLSLLLAVRTCSAVASYVIMILSLLLGQACVFCRFL